MKTTSFWGTCVSVGLVAVAAACGGKLATTSDDGGPGSGSSSGSGGGGSSGSSSGSSGSSGGSSSGSGSSGSSGSSTSSSGSSSGASSSSSGSSSGSGSSGSSGSSSGSSSGASSSSSGGSSGGGPAGSIYFEQCTGAAAAFCTSPQLQFVASFYSSGPGNGNCMTTTVGACTYSACSNSTPVTPGVSAGTLTVSGGSIGTVPVMPDMTNAYQYQANGTLFTAGQTLTVSASGATVPAFGPESVVAPAAIMLTAPSNPTGSWLISTSSDLHVAWAGGQSGAQVVLEGLTTTPAGYDYVACAWDAALGQASIPAAALKPLANKSGYLVYGQMTTTSFAAGPYPIGLYAVPYAGGNATFQ